MIVYTYSEARQRLAALLDQAAREGEVKIRRKDGSTFVIRPETVTTSPLDVVGISVGVSTDEIVQFVREGRRAYDTEKDGDAQR